MITNQKYVIGTFLYNFKLFVKDLKYSGDHRNKKNNSKFPLNTFQNSHDGHVIDWVFLCWHYACQVIVTSLYF